MLLNDPDDGKTAETTEAPSADDREGGSWNIT